MIIDEGKKEIVTISSAVKRVIDEMPDGMEFSGFQLKKLVIQLVPQSKHAYVATFLRVARKVSRNSFVCVQRRKSIYRKVCNG